ncbi:MAG TPA: hypothetical protein VIL99_02175 [Ignavibacteria bacterium]
MNPRILDSKKNKKCNFVKKDGSRCNARAIKGTDYCYFHSNDVPDEVRRAERSKGGKSKVLVIPAAQVQTEIKLNNPKQVTKFYSKLVNDVMSGTMDLRLATGVGYLLSGLLKAMELSEIENRISNLEDVLETNQRS